MPLLETVSPAALTCRRCRGAGEVYYQRRPVPVIGGKRIPCPECRDRHKPRKPKELRHER